jgi:hypothetical protein
VLKSKNLAIFIAVYFSHRAVGMNSSVSCNYCFLFFFIIMKLLIWLYPIQVINVILGELLRTSKIWDPPSNHINLLKGCTNYLIYCSNTNMIVNACVNSKILFFIFIDYYHFIFSFIRSCLKFRWFCTEWFWVKILIGDTFFYVLLFRNNWFFFFSL